MNGQNNGKTEITKPNISLIGQSKEGVKIWNHPVVEGISYTATIHLNKKATDFYAQDLTLENQFNYWGAHDGSSGAGRAVAFWDQGNRSVLKNVNYELAGYLLLFQRQCRLSRLFRELRPGGCGWTGFAETATSGLRNVISSFVTEQVTISQLLAQKILRHGTCFNNCTIRPETDKPRSWKALTSLAHSWYHSPACTFLNTKTYNLATTLTAARVNAGKVVRFHEYNSVDDSDTQIPLETRLTCRLLTCLAPMTALTAAEAWLQHPQRDGWKRCLRTAGTLQAD